MLTEKLFHVFTYVGAEWVLWLLIALSILSGALVVERLVFFLLNSSADAQSWAPLLVQGRFDEVKKLVATRSGMEAAVVRAALEVAPSGPAAVEEVIAGVITRERPPYERFLSFLGTLGNNAPFIGLFGTVIGIIKAFADLAVGTAGSMAKGGTSAVMAGISEALVATAVGIFVAIPAVVAFNGYNRWLKTIVARTNSLGHSLVAHLKKEESPASKKAA